MSLKLIVLEDGTRTELQFEREVVTIGRALDNDLRLNDARVSRHHCRLELIGEELILVDEGSQNGTEVNGEIVRRRALAQGDMIRLGKTRICYGLVPPEGRNGLDTAMLQAVAEVGEETSFQEVARERDNLRVLQKINKAINAERDLRHLLDLIVDSAIHLTHAERGFLILGHEESIRFEVARNFAREPIEMPELKVSRSITARVRESGKPLLSLNAKEDERLRDFASVENLKLLSIICVPLRIKGKIEGVLYVDNRLQKGIFAEEDLELLEALAEQAGIAVENAKLFEELEARRRKLEEQAKQIETLNAELGKRYEDQSIELQAVRETLVRERGRKDFPQIIGQSPRMKAVFQLLTRVVSTEFPVVIEGESGTGKELVAQAIHFQGPRKGKPFVTENCAALTDALLESELFGHMKGAFTGAHRTRKGLLELADGGTLFLDEVGDMSPDMQRKLLRFLQEGEVRPIGSDRVIKTDVRIVSASNRSLEALVREGKFREDLFYRLNVLRVELPPLRARREDVPILVEHFLKKSLAETGVREKKVSPQAMALLDRYAWPGNIRELENEVRKWAIFDGAIVTPEALSAAIRESRPMPLAAGVTSAGAAGESISLPGQIQDLEIRSIRSALDQAKGNKSHAAQLLGISRFALQRKLDKLVQEGLLEEV